MTCLNYRCSLFISLLLSCALLVGCGNGGDRVTDKGSVSQSTNQPIVPNPTILLTELPEMRQVIFFDKDSYHLDIEDHLLLDPLAIRLRQHPDSYLIVVGHSDDDGSEEDNIILSYERAFSVAIYISSVFGIEEERIQLVAAGNSEPITAGRTEVDRQKNRRVEVLSPKAIVRTLSAIQAPQF